MWMAKAKQATTIATQIAFAVLDLAVEMCTRPWIVELSKKPEITFDTIVWEQELLGFVSVFKPALKVEVINNYEADIEKAWCVQHLCKVCHHN